MALKREPCRACGHEMVYLPTRPGTFMPVNAETVLETDTAFDHKRHVSHFATCPKAGLFRRRRRPPAQPG